MNQSKDGRVQLDSLEFGCGPSILRLSGRSPSPCSPTERPAAFQWSFPGVLLAPKAIAL